MSLPARLSAAIVALVALLGLVVQFLATRDAGWSIGETLWILLRYFTILTNLLVLVVMAAVAAGRRLSPFLLGLTTLAILLVGVVYMTLLRGLLDLSGGAWLADTLLHKGTPALVPLWWLVFAPKGRLRWRDPLGWALFPLAYFPYALLRGRAEGIYAYPFINLDTLGWGGVIANAVAIAAGFLVAGAGLVALDRHFGLTSTRLPR